jgi:hypothetical protein
MTQFWFALFSETKLVIHFGIWFRFAVTQFLRVLALFIETVPLLSIRLLDQPTYTKVI